MSLSVIIYDISAKKKEAMEDGREYIGEVKVKDRYPIINKSVQYAKLRILHGLYLIGILWEKGIITPVDGYAIIKAENRLLC